MKKQFTNPTPIEPEKKKIEKLEESEMYVHIAGYPKQLVNPMNKIERTLYEKINEIIEFLNTHYSKDVRGGKFGGKIL